MSASLAVWAVSSSLLGLAVFAFAFGVFYGGWVAVMPTVVMDRFGARRIGSIIGALYTSVALGTLVGPSAAGFAFDASGSYLAPIVACMVANAVAALVVLRVPKA